MSAKTLQTLRDKISAAVDVLLNLPESAMRVVIEAALDQGDLSFPRTPAPTLASGVRRRPIPQSADERRRKRAEYQKGYRLRVKAQQTDLLARANETTPSPSSPPSLTTDPIPALTPAQRVILSALKRRPLNVTELLGQKRPKGLTRETVRAEIDNLKDQGAIKWDKGKFILSNRMASLSYVPEVALDV